MSDEKEENILIIRIVNAKTYYDKLGVKNDASNEQIVKACRKLLLNVHPDKCKHPQAKEATQVLIQVYKTLEQNRKEYDESLRTHTTFDVSTVRFSDEDLIFLLKLAGIGVSVVGAGFALGVLLTWLFKSDEADVEQEEESIERKNSTKMRNEKTPSNKRKLEETGDQQKEINEKIEKDMKKKSNLKKKRKLDQIQACNRSHHDSINKSIKNVIVSECLKLYI